MSEIHQYKLRNGSSPAWYDEGTGPTPDAWHLDCVQPDHIWRTVYQQGHEAALSQTAGVAEGPLSGKYGDVLRPFVVQMERELHANAGKGDRPGWLKMSPEVALLEIYYHLFKLQKAVKDGNGPGIQEYAADVANMSMMLLDICGGLALIEYAAPSASGIHPDALPDGTLSKSTAKRLAAASVSERARDDRFTAMLIGIIADVQDALGFTDEDKECSNGSLEIVAAIRELKEQALTQQRGEPVAWRFVTENRRHGPQRGHWRDVKDAGMPPQSEDLADGVTVEFAYTTPQPSADAVRELVSKMYGGAVAVGSDGQWVSVRRYLLDELESLISGGSHA